MTDRELQPGIEPGSVESPERRVIDWGRADDPWVFVEDLASQLSDAAELLRAMTDEAEEAYCESWSDATALGLWRAVVNAEAQPEERSGWGYEDTDRATARRLGELALSARCWWTWVGDSVRMVPLSEWEAEHGAMPREQDWAGPAPARSER